MKSILSIFFLFTAISLFGQQNLPYLKNNQLWVNNKPFIMIGGELHNSTASSIDYLNSTWPKLQKLNLNTVFATVSWDQFEPQEGQYDYLLIDHLVEKASALDMKLVIVWFGSWKNGQSSYIPLWVKRDTKRFPRVLTAEKKEIETLSVFSEESKNADKTAFIALMKRIHEIDKNQTVIMVQPENEVGIFQDIDYRTEALKAYKSEVPSNLMNYLGKNKKSLKNELKEIWDAAGNKMEGSWAEVFGDNPQSKEFFMAWNYARYINEIAEAGRSIHNVPMFVNAWIVQKPEDLPGVYPNGGPVSRVMDIYKAAAPSLDIISPDIYLPNYKEIYSMYHREDNPLLVPESSLDAARAFYAFAEYDAICFSPFGIEDAEGDILFSESYAVLQELMPLITEYQGTGKMKGVHLTKEHQDASFDLGEHVISLKIQNPDQPAYGLVIKTAENKYLVSGMNFKVRFNHKSNKKISYIGKVTEGSFKKGAWVEGRWLNGDETYHHELLRVFGRSIELSSQYQNKDTKLDVNEGEQFVYSPGSMNTLMVPGIYKITLYTR